MRRKRPFDREHRYVECRQRQPPSEVVRTVHGVDDKTVLGLSSAESSLIALLREQHTSGKRLLEIAPHTLVGGKVKGALDVSLGILPPGVRSILRCPKFPAELAMHVGKDSRHGGTECERVRPPRVHNPNH